MRTSEAGLALIKEFEGCKLIAYRDSVGILTIGWGHTGPEVTEGLQWSQEQANAQLAFDVEKFEAGVSKLVPENCTENQFSALVVWSYNLGLGNLRKLLAHPWDEIPDWMVKYNKAGGKVLSGLTRRREAEKALFLSPAPAS